MFGEFYPLLLDIGVIYALKGRGQLLMTPTTDAI